MRTPRGSREIAWADIDGVTVAGEPGGHLVLVTLRPGVVPPTPTAIGVPRWSRARRALIVMTVESNDSTVPEVSTALRRFGGDVYRPDATR
jgi:hypothetical protein